MKVLGSLFRQLFTHQNLITTTAVVTAYFVVREVHERRKLRSLELWKSFSDPAIGRDMRILFEFKEEHPDFVSYFHRQVEKRNKAELTHPLLVEEITRVDDARRELWNFGVYYYYARKDGIIDTSHAKFWGPTFDEILCDVVCPLMENKPNPAESLKTHNEDICRAMRRWRMKERTEK